LRRPLDLYYIDPTVQNHHYTTYKMPQTTQQTLTLITGASGAYGQRLIHSLIGNGTQPSSLILITRSPSKLADLAQAGCTVRKGSFDDPQDVLAVAFSGAETIFMISTSRAGARLPQHQNAISAAASAGVKHMVYTSFVGADLQAPTAMVAQEHGATEEMLRQSGMAWTVLRDSMYMEAIVDVALPPAVREGVLRSNAGSGKTGFVSRQNCVEAAAAVLKSPTAHQNVAYHITGPESLTWAEVAALAARLTGRPVEFQATTDEESFGIFDSMGIPRHPSDDLEAQGVQGYHWNSTDMVSFGKAIRLGELDVVSDDFRRLTGNTPTTIANFMETRGEGFAT
jgi:NAD(P)H dehydrogenase (quinone)